VTFVGRRRLGQVSDSLLIEWVVQPGFVDHSKRRSGESEAVPVFSGPASDRIHRDLSGADAGRI
jgi:hypothetical protein